VNPGCGRFAPSITGSAHPGTLLAALLCWLDARAQGIEVLVRLEDLDRTRLRPGQCESMLEALRWLGLDWDRLTRQSDLGDQHAAAMDRLAGDSLLYPCSCSRKQRQEHGRRTPDGGFAYDNRCRERPMPTANWRDCSEPLRLRLPDEPVALIDDSGLDLSQYPSLEFGDPIVRRRDGVLAYHLVAVVDDGASGVVRVVRGRDLASSTATQVQLQTLLGLPQPRYRHHFLLLEGDSEKLAKLHGSQPFESLTPRYSGMQFCGLLAQCAGLRDRITACTPAELLADFSWDRVRRDDLRFDA